MRREKRRVWAPVSSITNSDGAAIGYRTTRSISISERPGEACRIHGSNRKESDADTNVSIRVAWYTATGIGLR